MARSSRRNAGRHYEGILNEESRKVREHGKFFEGPYPKDTAHLLSLSKDDLVAMGTSAAFRELRRRGRGKDGVKLAWKK